MLDRSENKWILHRIETSLRSTGEGHRAFVGLAPGSGSVGSRPPTRHAWPPKAQGSFRAPIATTQT